MYNDWHYKLREQPPVILIGIIEKLEKKYNCKDDIETVLKDIEERRKSHLLYCIESEK